MALYHSAKGSVNYTVVGSPTIVDGVASGFSGSNYLQSSSTFPASTATSLVFSTKFKATSLAATSCIVSSTSSTIPFHLGLRPGGKIRLYPGRENASKDTSFVFSVNTEYWIRLLWDSSGWAFQYSTDGITYTTDFANYSPSDSSPKSNYVVIGRNFPSGGSEGFSGTIDLNKTYITVNEQPWFGVCPVEVKKHQIMGPVGYTVVGSPTISDGVVSGFSGSDYLQTANPINASDGTQFEIHYKFTTGNMSTGGNKHLLCCQSTVSGVSNWMRLWFLINKLRISYRLSDLTDDYVECSNYTTLNNTTYKAKVVYDGTNISIYQYDENGSLLDTSTKALSSSIFMNSAKAGATRIGNGTSSSYFSGSIDLNYTYIKVNGKLWFWQPQETKKIIVNGVTVWQSEEPEYVIENGRLVSANPNLYLESDGTSYIPITNYTPAQGDAISTAFKLNTLDAKWQTLYGISYDSGTYHCDATVDRNVTPYFYVRHFANDWTGVPFYPSVGTWYTYNIQADGTFELSSGETAQSAYGGPLSENILYLFAVKPSLNFLRGALKAFTITNNNVTKLHLVPVRQGLQIGNYTVPSNGMFDIVSQTFYGNLGSGSFTVGKDE